MDGSAPDPASGQDKRSDSPGGSLARVALLLGNFVIGIAVLAPSGMLKQLADGLEVSIGDAGLLITYGAVVLCFGSPLMAWATTRIDRRTLLAGTLLIVALGNAASALAQGYVSLIVIRLVMLVVAAIYTPQAASTVALIVPERMRPSAIAFVFLGWSLAVAAGLPIVTTVAAQVGWRATFGVLAAIALLSFALLALSLPVGLKGTPVSFASWIAVSRNRLILLLLAITVLQTAGPFMIFTYLGPLATDLAHASAEQVALLFAVGGITGFIGNVVATRLVVSWGAFRVSYSFQLVMLAGLIAWALAAGIFGLMAFGIGLWGLGFAALNSMQQARLVAADPKLASASVALNTSSIYVGQAIGSGVGNQLYTHGYHHLMGYAAVVFLLAALGTILATRPSPRPTAAG